MIFLLPLVTGLATHYLVGPKAWWVVGPILVLLLIDTRWAAAFFLVALGIGILFLLWRALPYIIFFAIGIAMVVGLILGIGGLMGV